MPRNAHSVTGESLVLAGEQPGKLAFLPKGSKLLDVRSTYVQTPQSVHYEQGRDYLIDDAGQIQRTPASRMPDFSTNVLYGQEKFDHGKFPGWGNNGYFVYVDYVSKEPLPCPANPVANSAALLPNTRQKLAAGAQLKIVAFGDSITAGTDAKDQSLVFWQRWVNALRQKYPNAKIDILNGATPGDTTRQGLNRLEEKVLSQKPDLVLIGFGMNDHNTGGYGVAVPAFQDNLRLIIDRIRQSTGAEVIVYSTFPPNPKWAYGSHNMEAYAKATQNVATEKQCAFANVYDLWQQFATRKKPEDMLANNINHPNEFGHWIYFQALLAIGL